ncbi:MAG TPA: cytochrome c [Vicinamibacteria bacterium]|nr:cytochrome c [Vicinamibacteria bacterium]
MREKRSLVVAFVGLLVAGALAQASEQRVTFTKDIAPIFQQKCESCHRDGSIAPMSLVSYEEIRPWARAIEEAVVSRYMPPWHIDKTVGIQEFKNDRSLSDDQIATIVAWVESGAPKGDPNDMPPPVSWPEHDGWMFAPIFDEPDLIVESPAYTMPAQAQDVWYRPVVETGLTEPRWVRAIEIRPDPVEGRRITHHALARLQQEEPQADRTNDEEDIGPGLFMEWAVGKQGELMRPNSGKLMLPGSKIAWDIHYHAVGEEITSQAQLAIYFYPEGETPKYRQVLGLFHAINGGSKGLDIPPNTVSVHQGFHVMKQAGRVENFQPHMHLRGKAMSMEAVLPNGERHVLSHVDHFQFNWHNNYVYADNVAPLLPRGTILNFTAWHDNTAANRSNPDPTQWVGWGDRTVDEMAHAWVNITYMSDEDYEAELEARKNVPAPTTDQQP